MLELSGNITMSFGAQYKAEDTASYILYGFDRKTLSTRAVAGEDFARYCGLSVNTAFMFDSPNEGICFTAYEPQLVPTLDGERVAVTGPSVVVERSIALSGDYKLHNYAVILGTAIYLMHTAGRRSESEQLSFGLEQTESTRHCSVGLTELHDGYMSGKLSPSDNLAMCLAMPKNRFKTEANKIMLELGVNRATLAEHALAVAAEKLAELFTVPPLMATVRLWQLNYV